MRKPLNLGRILAWAFLIILLILTLFPFYWMLRTALSNNTQLAAQLTQPVRQCTGLFQEFRGPFCEMSPRGRQVHPTGLLPDAELFAQRGLQLADGVG